MTLDLFHAIAAIVILLIAIYGFIRERQPPDIVAVLAILALLVTGVLTPLEAFSGFSHPATVSVIAVVILTAGLERTGILTYFARRVLSPLGRSEWLLTALLMGITAVASAFLVNTATVAVMIPVVIEVCRRTGARPGRILMPMAHAATFGGMCTLMGTSTNIVCHELALREGLPGFSMFELGRVGVPLLVAGSAYILLVGRWFLPRHSPEESTAIRPEATYEAEIVIGRGSSWIGKAIDPAAIELQHEVTLVGVMRDGEPFPLSRGEAAVWAANDHVRLRGSLDRILALSARSGLSLHRPALPMNEEASLLLAEAVILPASSLVGQTLEQVGFAERFDALVVALHRPGGSFRTRPHSTPLHAGDVLVVEGPAPALKALGQDPGFLVIGAPDRPAERPEKLRIAAFTMVAVVAVVALNLMPLVTAAVAGVALLVLTRCLEPRDVYAAVDWRIVFVMAGALALGFGLEKTGWLDLLAGGMARMADLGSPRLVLAVFFLTAMITSEFLSNSATAALIAPVALVTAEKVGLNPMALLAAVTFGASAAYAMPIGYQTSLMIFGPGRYRVRDYLVMGIPLDIIFAALAIWLIPRAWPVVAP
jgi:di/tricarboxylate transporter